MRLCDYDQKIQQAAMELKHEGKIKKVLTCIMSGKIRVQKNDDKFATMHDIKDVEKLKQESANFVQAYQTSSMREDDYWTNFGNKMLFRI